MSKITTASPSYSDASDKTIRLSLVWVELVTSILLAAIVVGYLIEAYALPSPYNAKSVGAGEFPIIIGYSTLIPLILLIIKSVANIVRKVPPKEVAISRPLSVLLAMVVLIVQTLLLDKVGLIIGIAVFSALLMLTAGERRPAFFIGVPLALALGIHAVFVLVLGVYFP